MNDVESLQQQVENVSDRLDAALHKLAEYQRVVAGAVQFGVYEKDAYWWRELCRLEQEQKGGLTPRAADLPIGYSVKSSMPKGYRFAVVNCPKCQRPVKENWLVKHIKSGCSVPATSKAASR